jgi:hypothetical protein
MTSAFDQVAALLLKLNSKELEEVRARAGILAQSGGANRSTCSASSAAQPDNDIDLVLSEIVGHMRSEGIEFASPTMIRNMPNFKSFADKVPVTMIYFRKVTTNRTKLRALIRMSINFLYRDLAKMRISASTRTLMNHWHRVPAVINYNFPGYAKIGLLGLLLHEGQADARYVSEATEEER